MPRADSLILSVTPRAGQPVFLALAETIQRDIERGRLKPGSRLPGTRRLARSLGLNRNTVDAAFQELQLQGWLKSEPARGTFVARDLPDRPAHPRRDGGARGDDGLERAAAPCDPPPSLSFSDGAPDPRLMPRAEVARAFRRALASPVFLRGIGYGDPRGAVPLREALAAHLAAERGLAVSPDAILVARGSQMALHLAAAALLAPGARVAVEDPGYPFAWSALRAAGARAVPVPVDGEGIDVAALERLCATEPVAALYVTPHHHYPTTVTLGAARRLRLMALAARGLTLLEDDYDHDYRFEGRPVLPLAARAEAGGRVVYFGSLSKLLAPGLRLGYAVADPALIARMAAIREGIDRQGDVPLELAVAALLADGTLRRHARKARRVYGERRDLCLDLLARHLGERVAVAKPAGGLALWLRLDPAEDAVAWADAAARAGLAILPGRAFACDPARAPSAFRLGYAGLDERELTEAVARLAACRPSRS